MIPFINLIVKSSYHQMSKVVTVMARKTAVFSDVTPSTWVNCRTLCTKRQQSSKQTLSV